jgi:hypothetical protein
MLLSSNILLTFLYVPAVLVIAVLPLSIKESATVSVVFLPNAFVTCLLIALPTIPPILNFFLSNESESLKLSNSFLFLPLILLFKILLTLLDQLGFCAYPVLPIASIISFLLALPLLKELIASLTP